jgi:hypothetical protein
MTRPPIIIQFLQTTHHARSHRIQVNVARQFQQVGIVLTDDRFISVLKEMAGSFMTQVKINNITGQKLLHTPENRLTTGPNQQMKVVGKEAPRIDNEIPVHALVRHTV